LGLVLTGWLVAAEPPHLQFVQGLRERNLPDLALEYLLKLSVKPPPELADVLPLELGKTRVDLANREADAGRKMAYFLQARGEFEDFVKKNPDHPLAAQANLEIAKVIGMQGRAQLSRARRQDTPEAQLAEAIPAREMFQQAGALLKDALPKMDAQLAKATDPRARDLLAQAKFLAEFEQGLNFLDQAQTYFNDPEGRNKAIESAIAILGRVSAHDPKHPICWQAKAWLGRAYMAVDKNDEARRLYDSVLAEKGDFAAQARQQAGYYKVLLELRSEADAKKRAENVQKLAEKWLEDHPDAHQSSEGYGVRYELARALFEQGNAIPKVGPNKDVLHQAARDLFARADRHFRILADTDNDYTDLARQMRKSLMIINPVAGTQDPIPTLTTLEQCQARAEREVAMIGQKEHNLAFQAKKLREVNPPDADKKLRDLQRKLQQEKSEHHATIIAALEHGLRLADAKTPDQDLGEARFLLAYVYLLEGHLFEAAILGEHQAYTMPKHTRSSSCAAYAIQAYAQLIARAQQLGSPPEELAADRERLHRLAAYMERTWPNDTATDFARHQLVGQLLKEGKNAEAIDLLAKISPSYGHYPQARYQLAWLLHEMSKPKEKGQPLDPQQKAYRDRAEQVLQGTTLASGDPDAAAAYLRCKLLLGQFLFESKRYDEMEKLAAELQGRLKGMKLTEQARNELVPLVMTQMLYSRYGRANDLVKQGQFAKVKELADPVIKEMEDHLKQGGPPADGTARMRRSIAVLALQALVQDNKMAEAQKLLDLLQRYAAADDDLGGGTIGVLVQMLEQLKGQIADLESKSDSPAAKAALARTKKSYGQFLDILAQQKKLPPEMGLFLATSYASLDQHAKAATLLEKVAEPEPFKEQPPEPLDPDLAKLPGRLEAYQKAVDIYNKKLQEYNTRMQSYRGTQIMLIRELRLAAKDATTPQDKQKYIDKTLAVLNKHMATDWGRKSFEVQRERVQLLEDLERYGGADGAIVGWNSLMKQIQPSDESRRRIYFDCYYHLVYCYYKNAQKIPDPKKKEDGIRRAAGFITKLETSEPTFGGDHLKDMYRKLLDSEPPLKQQYKEQGGKEFP
jgi:hypothetical protein